MPWLRRLSFSRMILLRACFFTVVIIACFALNRLIFGFLYGLERSGLDYFGLPLLRDTMLGFIICIAVSEQTERLSAWAMLADGEDSKSRCPIGSNCRVVGVSISRPPSLSD